MSDHFEPISLHQLLRIILNEFETKKSIWGIPQQLFFNPNDQNQFKTQQFNHLLDTPLGVAAGPHSQMAQNIIAAWLVGARYIELKTIQTLDELEIAKPCIDMQDEGYNCEWSQELKIQESFHEYLNAWIIIHLLHHKLGFTETTGTIFNMSVGYNLDGIMKPNVQWFFDKMQDCSIELSQKINEIKDLYPEIVNLNIPTQISDNITLSTMHGCPAHEIEEIATYLLQEKKLHTFVKLNPTLLGPEKLRHILNQQLNFKAHVPDLAFEHDLKYTDALAIIKALDQKAQQENLQFGLKLTNTLESINHKTVFDSEVEMMYMSGRALHPISINVAQQLQQEFKGSIPFSFSAGIDAFNVSDTLACGFTTITVCSDLLKPGGYMRMHQYFEEMQKSFTASQSHTIHAFITAVAQEKDSTKAAQVNLEQYAAKVLTQSQFKREYIITPDIKTPRELGYFDCISAPCTDTCATHQDIPNYLYYSEIGDFEKAYEIILNTNPFPSITGMVCDHLCQNKCTRVHYDSTLLIREVKRFVSEQKEVKLQPAAANGLKVGIIGAGPTGLSAAYYLALAGYEIEVFEAQSQSGGMVQYAIPGFRLTDEAIARDFKRVTDLGVNIHFNHKIDKAAFEQMQSDYHYVYVGAGAQLAASFDLEGNESQGVLDPLEFLFKVRKNETSGVGKNVVIIGGGNTAMDAARTSYRMVGADGKVSIVYRRTINEMPADEIEIKAVLEEGVDIMELVAPERIITENGHVKGLICSKMQLSGKDASGRAKPVKIPNSEFEIPCDTIIPALGQKVAIDFIDLKQIASDTHTYQTLLQNVFIGGDALRNASTAINAIGDGRKVANRIIAQSQLDYQLHQPKTQKNHSTTELMLKRAKRIQPVQLDETPLSQRQNFALVSNTLSEESIMEEASRCLHCDEICNICTTVCPNFANYAYEIEPIQYDLQKAVYNDLGKVTILEDQLFKVAQTHQILNIANFCNECGNCSTFCPTSSAPYKEKPKVHLTWDAYKKSEEGYFWEDLRQTLHYKSKNSEVTLHDEKGFYTYESEEVKVKLDKINFKIVEINRKNSQIHEFQFLKAAEMHVILSGISELV
jgi:putative selenate reductase